MGLDNAISELIKGFVPAKDTIKTKNAKPETGLGFDIGSFTSKFGGNSANASTKQTRYPTDSNKESEVERVRAIFTYCAPPGYKFEEELSDRLNAISIDTSTVIRSENLYKNGFFTTAQTDCTDPFFWFFGEPDRKYIQRYNVKDETTHTLPSPFTEEECCDRISDTVEQAVFLDGSWHFIVAPITPTTSNKICWSTIEYAPAIAEITPDYGQVKLLTSSRKSGSATFNQRGIGARFHHGFMSSEAGVRHYLQTLSQMARTIEETNKYQIMHKITSTVDQVVCHDLCHGTYEGKTLKDVYQDEVDGWDGFKKNPKFLFHIDNKITEKQRAMGAEVSDTWIVPPQVTAFVTSMETALTDPKRVGETFASSVFRDGPDALTTFRNSRIYVSRVMERDCDSSVDPLKFKEMIGEFFTHIGNEGSCCNDPSTYKSCYDDIKIYDESRGNGVFTTLEYAKSLRMAGRFNADGTVASYKQSPALTNFSEEELANDPLYMLKDGKAVAQQYYVNLPDSKLHAKSRIEIGESVKQSLIDGGVTNIKRGEELLSAAKQAIRQMEQYSKTAADAYWDLIDGGLGQPVVSDRANRSRLANRPLFPLDEYTVDGTGFNTFTYTGIDVGTDALPPGHQSWSGFKKLAQVWKSVKDDPAQIATSVFKNVDQSIAQSIADFVTLFEGIVAKLKLIFPSSEALNVKNSPSWEQRPTAETVLFQNFVHKHRVPIWKSGAQAGQAPQQGVAAQKQPRLRETLVQGFDNAVLEYTVFVQNDLQGATIGPNTQRIVNLYSTGGQGVPTKAAGYTDGPISLAGLTIDNYALFKNAIFISLAFRLLITKISSNEEDQESIQKKLDAIELIAAQQLSTNTIVIENQFNMGELFGKSIKALFSKKSGFKPALAGSYASYKELSGNYLSILDSATDLIALGATDAASNVTARTTLLSWPFYIQGLAQDVQAGQALTWTVSDPDLPDLPITTAKVLKETDLQEREDGERSPAFIESDLVESFDHLDLSRFARSIMKARQFDEDVGDDDVADMNLDQNSYESDRMIGAGFDGDEEEDFGSGRGRASTFGRGTGDLRHPSAKSAPKVSKAALGQGFQHFSGMPSYLFTAEAKENFTKLAACDDDSWSFVFASVFNYSRVIEGTLDKMYKFNVMKPYNIAIMRPHMRYHCLRVVKMKRGASTIRMYQKRGRACAGDNCELDEHFIKYIYKSNPVILNPKNICVLKCAFVTEILGGGGVKWISPENYNPQNREFGGDIIAVLLGRDEKLPEVINLSGYDTETEELYELADSEGRPQFSSAPWVNTALRLARGKKRYSDACDTEFITECDYVNQVMHKGVRKHCDPQTKTWVVTERGNGHWGLVATYDGANPARVGKEAYESLMPNRA